MGKNKGFGYAVWGVDDQLSDQIITDVKDIIQTELQKSGITKWNDIYQKVQAKYSGNELMFATYTFGSVRAQLHAQGARDAIQSFLSGITTGGIHSMPLPPEIAFQLLSGLSSQPSTKKSKRDVNSWFNESDGDEEE